MSKIHLFLQNTKSIADRSTSQPTSVSIDFGHSVWFSKSFTQSWFKINFMHSITRTLNMYSQSKGT